MDAHELMPTFLLGDLNADTTDLAAINDMTSNKGWTDLGGTNCEPTCTAPGATKSNRRDYVFANMLARHLVHDFTLTQNDEFRVPKSN